MARWKKTVAKILAAQNSKSFHSLDFDDFEGAIKGVGYEFHNQEGSHKVYKKAGWERMVILPENGKAIPYQVRDFRKELRKHGY